MFQHVEALRDIAQGCYCVLSSSILKTAIQTCKFSIPGPRFVAPSFSLCCTFQGAAAAAS